MASLAAVPRDVIRTNVFATLTCADIGRLARASVFTRDVAAQASRNCALLYRHAVTVLFDADRYVVLLFALLARSPYLAYEKQLVIADEEDLDDDDDDRLSPYEVAISALPQYFANRIVAYRLISRDSNVPLDGAISRRELPLVRDQVDELMRVAVNHLDGGDDDGLSSNVERRMLWIETTDNTDFDRFPHSTRLFELFRDAFVIDAPRRARGASLSSADLIRFIASRLLDDDASKSRVADVSRLLKDALVEALLQGEAIVGMDPSARLATTTLQRDDVPSDQSLSSLESLWNDAFDMPSLAWIDELVERINMLVMEQAAPLTLSSLSSERAIWAMVSRSLTYAVVRRLVARLQSVAPLDV